MSIACSNIFHKSEYTDYAASILPTAGLAVSNYIKIPLNGIPGYVPFLS